MGVDSDSSLVQKTPAQAFNAGSYPLAVAGRKSAVRSGIVNKRQFRLTGCVREVPEQNGVVDCVEGAKVRLMKDGRTIAETASDNYGDFKFDKLDENSGAYTIEIEAPGRAKKTVEARLGESVNLGEIRL